MGFFSEVAKGIKAAAPFAVGLSGGKAIISALEGGGAAGVARALAPAIALGGGPAAQVASTGLRVLGAISGSRSRSAARNELHLAGRAGAQEVARALAPKRGARFGLARRARGALAAVKPAGGRIGTAAGFVAAIGGQAAAANVAARTGRVAAGPTTLRSAGARPGASSAATCRACDRALIDAVCKPNLKDVVPNVSEERLRQLERAGIKATCA